MELAKIPGYQEAIAEAEAQEESLRGMAMLDMDLQIGGMPVRQMTPRHLLLLMAARSPFLSGAWTPEHVALFLWVVSPRFSTVPTERDAFLLEVAALPYDDIVREIAEYVEAATLDVPPSSRCGPHDAAPIVNFVAAIVHEIASAYGWDDQAILDKPLARLYQYYKLIDRDYCAEHGMRPRPAFSKLVSRAKKRVLAEYKAKRKAAAMGETGEEQAR